MRISETRKLCQQLQRQHMHSSPQKSPPLTDALDSHVTLASRIVAARLGAEHRGPTVNLRTSPPEITSNNTCHQSAYLDKPLLPSLSYSAFEEQT